MAKAHKQLDHPEKHHFTVFIFERFDESLILMFDKLGLTIEEVRANKRCGREVLSFNDVPH
jgi:hypothetical protein